MLCLVFGPACPMLLILMPLALLLRMRTAHYLHCTYMYRQPVSYRIATEVLVQQPLTAVLVMFHIATIGFVSFLLYDYQFEAPAFYFYIGFCVLEVPVHTSSSDVLTGSSYALVGNPYDLGKGMRARKRAKKTERVKAREHPYLSGWGYQVGLSLAATTYASSSDASFTWKFHLDPMKGCVLALGSRDEWDAKMGPHDAEMASHDAEMAPHDAEMASHEIYSTQPGGCQPVYYH